MTFKVIVRRSVLKDIENLPKEYSRLIGEHINQLAENPRPVGAKKLRGRSDYSLRVGTYRILYTINDEVQLVTVHRVKHRRDVYRE